MFGKSLSWILLFSIVSFCGSGFAASALTMGDAIDKAGRQRMLTQRMIKSYSLVGMKLKPGAEHEMEGAASLFSAQLAELTAFAEGDAEREQVGRITLLWGDLRTELDQPPSLDRAGEFNDLAELLLQESHKLVLILEKRSGTVAGKLVNISGRQRMLSQRIAKIYLLETWGLGSDVMARQYEGAVSDFSDALVLLMEFRMNTPDIAEGLAAVKKNWDIFGISKFSQKYEARVPSLVVRSMDKILVQVNGITAMYAQLH
ncbi:MAG: type IV pili methyl-accepting chemotaxis transducer N-terminal domain-containing protein [Candidatus Sedimenticola endophacoides]